ncbi:hypothetical protein [Legionella tunisiensis]|uniref:hypothetical protein n=1 Tax=Legionella tunisiensis TaxID=1034944 RepID=UPI0002DBE68B|nr:hypothetical protein [Legionella tunisiensis]
MDVQVPVLDAQAKDTIGQVIYKFFSGWLAAIAQYAPNIFGRSTPAEREGIAMDRRSEQPVVAIGRDVQEERRVEIVSSQESWLSRKKAGELVQSSMSYVSSLRSLFWSTPQSTNTQRHDLTLDTDESGVKVENRF